MEEFLKDDDAEGNELDPFLSTTIGFDNDAVSGDCLPEFEIGSNLRGTSKDFLSILETEETDNNNKKRSASCISNDLSFGPDTSVEKHDGDVEVSTLGNGSFMSMDAYPTPEEIAERLQIIQDANSNNRIRPTKAANFEKILQSGLPYKDIVTDLLNEFIPKKRTKKSEDGDEPVRGYVCKICVEPLKGHVCLYCEVCSSAETKYEKGEGHVCINCTSCFFKAKKKKKLVQVKVGKCKCVVNKTEV